MGRIPILWLAVALIACATSAQSAPEQSAAEASVADSRLANVVSIEHEGGAGAAGFIVGREGDIVWVATAAHVVFVEDPNAVERVAYGGLRVRLNGRTETFALAGPPLPGFPDDLAFLRVRIPLKPGEADIWWQLVLDDDPEPGEAVRIAALPSAIGYGPWSGRVVRGADGAVGVRDMALGQAGQSGAPVADSRGFIGMYVKSAGDRMIPMAIVRKGAISTGVPWNLVSYPPHSIPIHLCFDVTGAAPAGLVMNSVDGGIARFDASGCTATRSGSAIVNSKDGWIRCSPQNVVLPRDPEQRLTVSCGVNVAGSWSSPSLGHLDVTAAGEDRWKFQGFERAPSGWIRGTMTWGGGGVLVSGESQFGQAVNGVLTIEPRRIHGTLDVGGGPPVEVDLTRW